MGFTVVFIVIGIGWILGRRDTLGTHAQKPLSLFVYYVATPALLFDRVTKSDTSTIFSLNFVVIALSALIVGFLFFLLMRFVIKRTAAVSVIGMLAASYANAGNLGIPLAAYILDDFTVVIPVILFQVAFYAPITMTIMEMLTNKKSTNLVRNLLVTPLTNTMVLAAIAGIAVSLTSMSVPVVIAQPVEMLANASVPLALVVFGLSLSKSKIPGKGAGIQARCVYGGTVQECSAPNCCGTSSVGFWHGRHCLAVCRNSWCSSDSPKCLHLCVAF